MRRLLKGFFVFFCLLFLLEATCFALAWPVGTGVADRSELLVVFKSPGTPMQKVFPMLKQGAAVRFAIPGMSQQTITSFTRKYSLPPEVKYIPAGDRTESTFEDARQAGKVIRDGGFHDVLLVAADYHVARAKLLLLAETSGSGCRIRLMGIPGGWSFRQQVAHWYNEAVKLPGSVLELVWYHASGRLLTSYPRLNGVLERVKRGVLIGEGV